MLLLLQKLMGRNWGCYMCARVADADADDAAETGLFQSVNVISTASSLDASS